MCLKGNGKYFEAFENYQKSAGLTTPAKLENEQINFYEIQNIPFSTAHGKQRIKIYQRGIRH